MNDSSKKRATEILKRLKKTYPGWKCSLDFSNSWELLVAVILSAQCTDARVNKVTPLLFRRFRTVRDYAEASQEEMERYVHSTGFYRNKARNIRGAAKMLLEKFGGKIPRKMEEILQLPGVARKTANVVLAVAYGIKEGVVVDTHVRRLSNRLGLTHQKNPEKIEKDLMKIVPQKDWDHFSLLLIYHGRQICTARKPACEKCVLNDICPSAFRV